MADKIKCPGCNAEIDPENNEAHFPPAVVEDEITDDGPEICEVHETEKIAGVCNECEDEQKPRARRNRFKR